MSKTKTKSKPAVKKNLPAKTSMHREVINQDERPVHTGHDLIEVIHKVASDPKCDVDKIEKLLDIQMRIMAQQAKMSFARDLAKVQSRIPMIKHDARIVHVDKNTKKETLISTYTRFETMMAIVKPIYDRYGFTLTFTRIRNPNALTTFKAVLLHPEGHSEESVIDLPIDNSGGKNGIQGVGSSNKYGKRYLVEDLFNIVTIGEKPEDDDGNGAGAVGAGKNRSNFDARAEAALNPHDSKAPVNAESVRVEDVDSGDYSAELSEIGEDDIEPWDNKTIFSAPGKAITKEFESGGGAATYLMTIMRNHKTQKSRIELINLNMPLIKHLKALNQKGIVQKLHDLAEQGTREAA